MFSIILVLKNAQCVLENKNDARLQREQLRLKWEFKGKYFLAQRIGELMEASNNRAHLLLHNVNLRS